jgi:hypothetical protein
MDAEYTDDVMANREEAMPVMRIPSQQDDETTIASTDAEAESDKQDAGSIDERVQERTNCSDGRRKRQSLQERFLNGIMAQVLPPEEGTEDEEGDAKTTDTPTTKPPPRNRRSKGSGKSSLDRPNFSLPLMSSNFRRFNARVGVLFVLQTKLIHLFAWQKPTATLSFLAVYTLLCLQPSLVPLLPVILVLFYIMIPSFMARHPVPANDPRVEPEFTGPAVAPASRVRPAPEMSKDFFRNMRDLQNSMEDFSRVHDAANEFITPYTNFSDERVSSLLFAVVFGIGCIGSIGAHLVPWRAVMLLAGWTFVISCHPEAQRLLLSTHAQQDFTSKFSTFQTHLKNLLQSEILLDSPPEARQVEIFELQKYHSATETWEPWLFTPTPHDPRSPSRFNRPKGTQFFEEVQPPPGWAWRDKKWNLDLASREWVEQRLIHGVEVETEGERWVYDLPAEVIELEESALRGKGKGKKKVREIPKSGWEEGTGIVGARGEWRRRRWVRLVERRAVNGGQGGKKGKGRP